MTTVIIYFLVIAGILFIGKMLYVMATAGALPVTQGALFTSSAAERIEAFVNAVSMEPGDQLVDIGCGDGRVLRACHHRYGVKALGYEVNLMAYLLARLLSLGSKGVVVRWKDFWGEDLGAADIVFCYLFPDVMKRLAKKLEKELRSGTRVVSCNFPLPGWKPTQVLRPDSERHRDPIYVYISPAQKTRSQKKKTAGTAKGWLGEGTKHHPAHKCLRSNGPGNGHGLLW